jgi:hypothetical protein
MNGGRDRTRTCDLLRVNKACDRTWRATEAYLVALFSFACRDPLDTEVYQEIHENSGTVSRSRVHRRVRLARDKIRKMKYDELTPFAKQLRDDEGIASAKADLFNGKNGLLVDGEFFPLDELNDPANADLLRKRDFKGIAARRGDK